MSRQTIRHENPSGIVELYILKPPDVEEGLERLAAGGGNVESGMMRGSARRSWTRSDVLTGTHRFDAKEAAAKVLDTIVEMLTRVWNGFEQ